MTTNKLSQWIGNNWGYCLLALIFLSPLITEVIRFLDYWLIFLFNPYIN